MTPQEKEELGRQLSHAAWANNVPQMEELLEQGADIHANSGNFMLPLFRAAQKGNEDAVRFLLSKGADPDVLNINTRDVNATPMMAAAHAGHRRIVDILLAAGADPGALSSKGKTAAHYAGIMERTVLQHFLEKQEALTSISFMWKAGTHLIEEHFNFARRERVTFVLTESKAVETFTREKFSDIDEKSLKKAFDEHVRRGGTTDVDMIFPGVMSKALKPCIKLG